MRPLLLAILLSITVAACQQAPPTESVESDDAPTLLTTIGEAGEQGARLVYDYETFAPLLSPTDDKVYVINFWATWCKPCVEELPYFQQLHEAYNKQGVEFVFVSLDFPRQIDSKYYPFLEERQLKGHQIALLDTRSSTWVDKVHPAWSGAIPATLYIQGDRTAFHEGSYADYEQLATDLQDFIDPPG